MSNLIRNIKEHKIAALIGAGLLIAVIAALVLLIMSGRGQNDESDPDSEKLKPTVVTDYFADSDYPVKVTSGGKGFSMKDRVNSKDLKNKLGSYLDRGYSSNRSSRNEFEEKRERRGSSRGDRRGR